MSKIKVISETLFKVCYKSGEVGKLIDMFKENINEIQPEIFHLYIMAQP